MMESSLDSFSKPIYPQDIQDEVKNKDRILGLIMSKGSSYPSELASHLFIDYSLVNALVLKLINEGKIKRIIPDHYYPQPMIACRIGDMRAIGVNTFEKFIQRSWLVATQEGIYYYAMKFNGEHRQCSETYIEAYGIKLEKGYKY